MNVAVIPARGGSKRIPGKNIKEFAGKPMIAWSIQAALDSSLFDLVIVSTDCHKIAEVALENGALVPFIRPDELADDFCGTTEVIAHATKWVLNTYDAVDFVCCIYATAPFVRSEDIIAGFETIANSQWLYCFTAAEYAAPIQRSFEIQSNGGAQMLFPEQFSTRSQDLHQSYHDAAQFYWGKPEAWVHNYKIFDKHSKPLVIPRWRVQDIDTIEDWYRAELMSEGLIKQVSKKNITFKN